LRERLATGALPVRKAIEVAIQIARGLAAAHDKGLVHRDLKPENVFLTKDGQVKILDFGLARQMPTNTGATETIAAVTDPGTVMGTVGYMAPEQIRGLAIDGRTDLFALGAVLYEMLAGRRAFAGATPADTMIAIVKEDPPDLAAARTDLPPAIDRIVRHSLEKNPHERFQSARDVAFALEALSGSGAAKTPVPAELPSQPRRQSLLLKLVAGLAAAAIVFFIGRQTVAIPPPVPSIQFERKTFNAEWISRARFMSDGQTIVFSATARGWSADLFVLRPGDLIPQPLGQTRTELLAVSKDDELLVLTAPSYESGMFSSGTLAHMRRLDSAPQPISGKVRSADWAPDGKHYYLVRDAGEGIDQLESPEGAVLYQKPGFLSDVRVSPRGDYVAFMSHQTRWDDRGRVMLARTSDGWVEELTGENAAQLSLAWLDEVTLLVSVTERSEEAPIRAINVTDRSNSVVVEGPGHLSIHDVAHDVARTGDWLVIRQNHHSGIRVHAAGDTPGQDLTYAGNTWYGSLSRDCAQLLFTEWGGTVGSDYAVGLRKLGSTKFSRLGAGSAAGLSPDGKWALAYLPTSLEIRAYSTTTGVVKPLNTRSLQGPNTSFSLSWYPNSSDALVCASERSRKPRCYRVSIEGAEPEPVTEEGVESGIVHDDGRVLARRTDGSFAMYPPGGGTPVAVNGLTPDDFLIDWADDGRVFVGKTGLFLNINKVDLRSGRREAFQKLQPPGLEGLMSVGDGLASVSRDGRCYTYRYTQALSTMYLVIGATPFVPSR
jgi:hypothetical protein